MDKVKLTHHLFDKKEKYQGSTGYYGNSTYVSKDTPEVIDQKYWAETNLYNDWPYGRALYSNDDQSFVINVNNIDHLEIKANQSSKNGNVCDI